MSLSHAITSSNVQRTPWMFAFDRGGSEGGRERRGGAEELIQSMARGPTSFFSPKGETQYRTTVNKVTNSDTHS